MVIIHPNCINYSKHFIWDFHSHTIGFNTWLSSRENVHSATLQSKRTTFDMKEKFYFITSTWTHIDNDNAEKIWKLSIRKKVFRTYSSPSPRFDGNGWSMSSVYFSKWLWYTKHNLLALRAAMSTLCTKRKCASYILKVRTQSTWWYASNKHLFAASWTNA